MEETMMRNERTKHQSTMGNEFSSPNYKPRRTPSLGQELPCAIALLSVSGTAVEKAKEE